MRLLGGWISITVFPLTSGSREVELSSSRMVEPASRRGTGCLESQWPVASSQADPQMQLRLLRKKWAVSHFQNSYIWQASPWWTGGWRWNCYQRTRLSLSCNCVQQCFVRKMGFTVWFAAHEQHQLCECVSSDTKSCQSILSAGSMCEGFDFSADKFLFCELFSCCERVKVILESGVRPQESSGPCIVCSSSIWEGVWMQFLVNVATVCFLWNQQNDEAPRGEIPFLRQVSKFVRCFVFHNRVENLYVGRRLKAADGCDSVFLSCLVTEGSDSIP